MLPPIDTKSAFVSGKGWALNKRQKSSEPRIVYLTGPYTRHSASPS